MPPMKLILSQLGKHPSTASSMAKGRKITAQSSTNRTIIVYRDCLFLAVASFIFLFAYFDTSSTWLVVADATSLRIKPDHDGKRNITTDTLAAGDLAFPISRTAGTKTTDPSTH
ncbi:uncharacterized protein AB675_5877 [Cyphellophora attinorum]|uniref:Uncharacterized protein n=1 Tax=Cyphellophora attinorum TaxID=1664694 RepID=A0A0N1HS71_9EURO|nr:uncharacterized protein AB675_5877 [Phialophora attinorum]KPI38903.1 hypothetical protein AB675_5877 [Phialophora attinorum]